MSHDRGANEVKNYRYFRGGQWMDAEGGRRSKFTSPTAGKLLPALHRHRARMPTLPWMPQPKRSQPGPIHTSRKSCLFLNASRSSGAVEVEIAEILARETGSTISSRPSRWTWLRRRCNRSPVGSICPKARFWKQINRILIPLACVGRWAFAQASRHGMAPTFFPGEL